MSTKELVDLILNRLDQERDSIRTSWLNPVGTKTRHFVIDSFLPEPIAHLLYDAFPKNGEGFHDRESFREKKRTSAHLSQYAPILGDITYAFQDAEVVAKVANLVDFQHIEPDPSLYAGGLSMMFKGDFLNPHIDNSHDADRARYRRLNLLLYVTPDWCLENGGNFELWNEQRTIAKTLVSKFNRLIVMETNRSSWHSVSPVVANRARCCVSNYYFSVISPDESQYFHVTSFDGRPDQGLKRLIGRADNAVRNVVSQTLRIGRGKDKANRER